MVGPEVWCLVVAVGTGVGSYEGLTEGLKVGLTLGLADGEAVVLSSVEPTVGATDGDEAASYIDGAGDIVGNLERRTKERG